MSRAAQTIVSQVSGGHATDDERFLIFHEVATDGGFKFIPDERKLTRREASDELLAQGLSEEDARSIISEAVAAFGAP